MSILSLISTHIANASGEGNAVVVGIVCFLSTQLTAAEVCPSRPSLLDDH